MKSKQLRLSGNLEETGISRVHNKSRLCEGQHQFRGAVLRLVVCRASFILWVSARVVYEGWVIGVVLLYPLCKWFAGVKARRRDWWLSYL